MQMQKMFALTLLMHVTTTHAQTCPPSQYLHSTTQTCTPCITDCYAFYQSIWDEYYYYTAAQCTATTNTDCQPCTSYCPYGEYLDISSPCSNTHNPPCIPCDTDCPADHYVSALCSLGKNTECAPCGSAGTCSPPTSYATSCYAGYYTASLGYPSACLPCTPSCPPGKYKTRDCSNEWGDIACSTCRDCLPSEGLYTLQNCTAEDDTVCRSCGSCGMTSYISTPCSLYAPQVCSPCTTCPFQVSWEKVSCSVNADTQCEACPPCEEGYYLKEGT